MFHRLRRIDQDEIDTLVSTADQAFDRGSYPARRDTKAITLPPLTVVYALPGYHSEQIHMRVSARWISGLRVVIWARYTDYRGTERVLYRDDFPVQSPLRSGEKARVRNSLRDAYNVLRG